MSNILTINGIHYSTDFNIIYYFCQKRNIWLPHRNYDLNLDKERFFIDQHILTHDQILDYEFYKNVRDVYIPYEEWRKDPEFPDYEFSSLGRFKLKNGEISQKSPSDDGYIKVKITGINSNKVSISLHRILAKLFVYNDDIVNKIEVDHVNSIRHDNRIINLNWVTRRENNTDKTFNRQTNSSKRPVDQYDQYGNFIKRWESASEISLFYGTDTIYYNLEGNKLYKGFYWYRPKDELLEGEVFKDLFIPELSKIVKISNKGRIFNERGRISSGNINKQGYVRTSINGKEFKIHKLVMMTFNPIVNQDDYVVDHIDGNRSNNNLENLRWVTNAQNIQLYYSQNEIVKNEKSSLTRKITFTNVNDGSEFQFNSIVEAIQKTGFTNSQIKGFLAGKYKNPLQNIYGNFTIRYTDGVERKKQINNSMKVKVVQYDINGNYIKTHDSATDAGNLLGILYQSITKCCRGHNNTAGGFIWKYEDENRKYVSNIKEVIKFDINGNYVCCYKSIADAEKDTKISYSSIVSVCKGNPETISAGNYIWRYKDEYLKLIEERNKTLGDEL